MSVESLEKKLNQIKNMFKDVKAQIKMPKPPSTPKMPGSSQKMPGVAPKNQKDPTKMAEQIKNPEIKDQVMDSANRIKETMSTSKLGQWSIKSK